MDPEDTHESHNAGKSPSAANLRRARAMRSGYADPGVSPPPVNSHQNSFARRRADFAAYAASFAASGLDPGQSLESLNGALGATFQAGGADQSTVREAIPTRDHGLAFVLPRLGRGFPFGLADPFRDAPQAAKQPIASRYPGHGDPSPFLGRARGTSGTCSRTADLLWH